MRRLAAMLLCGAFLISAPACKRKAPAVDYVDEGSSQLSTVVRMGDTRAAAQLLRGFHDVENGSWRWTMKKFAATLRVPEAKGKTVKAFLNFTLPESVASKIVPVELTARVNGKEIGRAMYEKAGEQKFVATVPPEVLSTGTVALEFELDKAAPAGSLDQRELGVIATAIGLRAE